MNDTARFPVIADRLSKSFTDKPVLTNLDLAIEPGTVLGLLGANGSGKTTLIKCLLGLLRPSGGQATVFGDPAWDLSAATKERIGYVPQEVATYPWMRVRHVIDYTAAFYPKWNRQLVADLCQRWRLPLDDRSGTLSVGQLQTLGIVLAMGHEPELLILDEPVASLDPSARREFLRMLIDLVDHPNRTVLFSTHITSDLERVASKIALLREGHIEFCGDLDLLKDRVKRLRIMADHDLPASFGIAGALSCQVDGRMAVATVADLSPDDIEAIRTTWKADVTVSDLNLEEIFVELHEHNAPRLAETELTGAIG
ncbi:ABC transporter ATP-binding protein [Aeoliella mucimassa]|uniref:Putative ABC transporter ATP-binding protein YxlF n=1 Tax=Aeoliella mucimassa TaxID=2527972 RepID=A0A518AHZ1_9BACT|nr:ABC transporter ATP-binding protein [Aeoliella mucimassa]QDU54348.1 putative ABC transporter ATP-binding protein YxlF [Aeoliella mucimassa]